MRQKELARSAAAELETTSTLVDSALGFETEKVSHGKPEEHVLTVSFLASVQVYGAMEDEGENVAPQPGHFTKVYLETLRKANQR